MKFFSLLMGLFAMPAWALAQGAVWTLLPPTDPLAPGATVDIDLVAFNPTGQNLAFEPPATLHAVVVMGERSWPVVLQAQAPAPAFIAAGGFAARRYAVGLPTEVDGRVVIELAQSDLPPSRTAVDVRASLARSTVPEAAPPSALASATPASAAVVRSFAGRLAPHDSIYFIYGPDAPAAKFQFSFKYRGMQFREVDGAFWPQTLQFGYTQRSLWDIGADSSPFYDTSYMPELMLESLAPMPEVNNRAFTWLGYQLGVKHESNGRDGAFSRSLNTVNLRTFFTLGSLDGWNLVVVPEVFAYIGGLSDNPRLKDYRGYGQLRWVFGRNNGPSLLFTGRAGKDFGHGSLQLDFTLPVRTRLLNFATYFLVQYFDGYGESLLSFDQKSDAIRAGFSLVR